MTKNVQQVGGPKAEQDVFVGEARQITVDTDNWDLLLHDGVTPGGRRILNQDNGDERWQQRSEELDGFNFNPEGRGFLVRLSAGNYRLRVLRVDERQLGLTNPDGYDGNPQISLKERISTTHIFEQDLGVEGDLEVAGEISGDTFGTHNGPVVGNVTGNVTGDVTGDAAGNHTGSFTGDVDVRGQTIQLDAGQIPLAALNGLIDFIKLHAVPEGIIMLWSGTESDIPAGWELCNGLNGTPDLTDKFVIGAGSLDFEAGDQGGSLNHTHANTMSSAGSHTHSITIAGHALTTNEMPNHRHGSGATAAGSGGADIYAHGNRPATTSRSFEGTGSAGTMEGWTSQDGGGEAHTHAGSSADSAGSHTHAMNNVAASSLPPYYALCYIMRVIS